MKIKIKFNPYCVCIFFLIALFEKVFFLLPTTVAGVKVTDFATVLCTLFVAFIICKFSIQRRWDKYGLLIIAYLIMNYIAAVMGKIHWNQKILSTLFVYRGSILILLSYFAITVLLQKQKVSRKQLIQIVVLCGKIELIIMMIQFVLAFSGINILTCEMRARNGLQRYFINGSLIMFVLIYEMINLIDGKKKLKSFIWCIFAAVFFFFMNQTRMILIGLILSTIIYFISWKANAKKKLFVMFLLLVMLGLVSQTTLFQSAVNIEESEQDTSKIRKEAMLFYLEELKDSPIAGLGLPNSIVADLQRGKLKGYNLNDNGIVGLMFMYGGIGLLWIFYNYYYMLRDSILLKKICKESYLFFYAIFTIVISSTLIFWYWDKTAEFVMVIIWTYLNDFRTQINMKNDKKTNME